MQPKASCPWSLKTTPWSLNLTCFVAILYWVSQTFSREVKCCALLSPLLLSPPPRLSRPPRRLWEWASTPRLVHAAKCVLQNLACSFCLSRFDRVFATPSTGVLGRKLLSFHRSVVHAWGGRSSDGHWARKLSLIRMCRQQQPSVGRVSKA